MIYAISFMAQPHQGSTLVEAENDTQARLELDKRLRNAGYTDYQIGFSWPFVAEIPKKGVV